MASMKVYELFQCIFWSLGVIVPLGLMGIAEDSSTEDGSKAFARFIAMLAQISVLVAAYKAGGK